MQILTRLKYFWSYEQVQVTYKKYANWQVRCWFFFSKYLFGTKIKKKNFTLQSLLLGTVQTWYSRQCIQLLSKIEERRYFAAEWNILEITSAITAVALKMLNK